MWQNTHIQSTLFKDLHVANIIYVCTYKAKTSKACGIHAMCLTFFSSSFRQCTHRMVSKYSYTCAIQDQCHIYVFIQSGFFFIPSVEISLSLSVCLSLFLQVDSHKVSPRSFTCFACWVGFEFKIAYYRYSEIFKWLVNGLIIL